MRFWRGVALTVVLSLLTGALGAFVGARYVLSHAGHSPPLHQLVHEQLRLTAGQQRRIEGMERDFAVRRAALEGEMRAANAEIAAAFEDQHAYTPRMQAAVDRFHRAMETLQKESMAHVIAMRAVLTPEQARRFDATVVKSLTDDAGS